VSQCFDARQACSPTRVIPVSRVVDLLSITHAPERVETYRKAMLRGDLFPPISVLPLLGWYLVTDGHKRLTAFRPLGGSEVLVQEWTVWQGIAHLGRQTTKEAHQVWKLVSKLGRDPSAPAQLKKFMWSRALHYRRLGRSLWARVKR